MMTVPLVNDNAVKITTYLEDDSRSAVTLIELQHMYIYG